MRANKGITRDLEGEGICLKKGQSAFQREGDVMVHVWKDKRLVQMISTIHDVTIVNTGKQTWNKDALCCQPVQQTHERSTQGRPVPQLFVSSEENCKMVKKGGIVSAKLCALQCIFCVQDTKYTQKLKYKNFLHEVRRSLISEVQNRSESCSDDF